MTPREGITSLVFIVGLVLAPGTTDAQSPGPRAADPHRTYSRHIVRRADSVLYIVRVQMRVVTAALRAAESGDEDVAYDEGAALAMPLAVAIRRKAGDFDAVTPPSRDFERVHQQLVDALKVIAEQSRVVSENLASLSCSGRRQAGMGCDGPRIRQYRLPVFMERILALNRAAQDYADARDRVKALLLERSVILPPLKPIEQDLESHPSATPAPPDVCAVISAVVKADTSRKRVTLTVTPSYDIRVGNEYEVLRVVREVRNPPTGRPLRDVAALVGTLRVKEVGDGWASGTLTGDSLKAGDLLGTCPDLLRHQ